MIQRYGYDKYGGYLDADKDGAFVLYEDHVKAVSALREVVDHLIKKGYCIACAHHSGGGCVSHGCVFTVRKDLLP